MSLEFFILSEDLSWLDARIHELDKTIQDLGPEFYDVFNQSSEHGTITHHSMRCVTSSLYYLLNILTCVPFVKKLSFIETQKMIQLYQ